MQDTIITQGLELMLYGMGTVVVFLSLLVVATGAMSSLIERFFVEPQPAARPTSQPAAKPADDGELIAVISAAVARHRQRQGR